MPGVRIGIVVLSPILSVMTTSVVLVLLKKEKRGEFQKVPEQLPPSLE